MNTRDIYDILVSDDNSIVHATFTKNKNEFEEYKKTIAKKGSSIKFNTGITREFSFSKEHLLKLCNLFLQDIINEIELNYLVDNIIASIDSFQNEEIFEDLSSLTDPEINGNLTKDYVTSLKDKINSN